MNNLVSLPQPTKKSSQKSEREREKKEEQCDGADVVKGYVLQEVQRFAVKQIKGNTTAVSANQDSGFILLKQTKSQHSQFFLSLFQSHAPMLMQCNAGRREHLYRLQQKASLGNRIGEMCVSCPLQIVFSAITKPIKAWMISNESLKMYLLNHINRMHKQNVAVLLQEWEACLDSSVYKFMSLNHS